MSLVLCRRSAPEAPANIAAIRLAAYKGQLDAAEQASDAAAAAAADAAQAAAPLHGTSSQARAAVARAVLCSPAKPGDLPAPRRSMSRDLLRSGLSAEPVQAGSLGSGEPRALCSSVRLWSASNPVSFTGSACSPVSAW